MFGSNKGSGSPRNTHGPIVKTGPTKGQNTFPQQGWSLACEAK